MIKRSAWLLAGAVLATAGVAHAQEATTPAIEMNASRAAVPWYQRFTTSNGLTENMTGERDSDRIMPRAWNLDQRWGVTVDVTEPAHVEHSPEAVRGQQTSVGAFYNFTPSARVGAELRVEDNQVQSPLRSDQRVEPSAGVRVEFAFRF